MMSREAFNLPTTGPQPTRHLHQSQLMKHINEHAKKERAQVTTLLCANISINSLAQPPMQTCRLQSVAEVSKPIQGTHRFEPAVAARLPTTQVPLSPRAERANSHGFSMPCGLVPVLSKKRVCFTSLSGQVQPLDEAWRTSKCMPILEGTQVLLLKSWHGKNQSELALPKSCNDCGSRAAQTACPLMLTMYGCHSTTLSFLLNTSGRTKI